LAQPDTLVITREHYERFRLTRPQMLKLVETELGRSDMLYLGWDQTDPAFAFVFGEVLGRFGADMRPGYAALCEITPLQAGEWRRRNIQPVTLPAGDPIAALTAWLTELGGRAPADASEPGRMPATTGGLPADEAVAPSGARERTALQTQWHELRAYIHGLEQARLTAGPIEQVKIDLEIARTQERLRAVEAALDALAP
jgi:hypothetical protein